MSELAEKLQRWSDKREGRTEPAPPDPDKHNAIYEDAHFIIFLNGHGPRPDGKGGKEHGPAHVHIRMKNADPANKQIREARLILLKGQPGPHGEIRGWCETYPYFSGKERGKMGLPKDDFYWLPSIPRGELPERSRPPVPRDSGPMPRPRATSRKKFSLEGEDLARAMECVNTQIDLCIDTWMQAYRGTPEEHNFATKDMLEGINIGMPDPVSRKARPRFKKAPVETGR